jgi:hypothetical protein
VALADTILADVTLAACVAKSLLASALRRPLTAADACSVQWVVLGMQGRIDLRGALLSVITSPAFLHEAP